MFRHFGVSAVSYDSVGQFKAAMGTAGVPWEANGLDVPTQNLGVDIAALMAHTYGGYNTDMELYRPENAPEINAPGVDVDGNGWPGEADDNWRGALQPTMPGVTIL